MTDEAFEEAYGNLSTPANKLTKKQRDNRNIIRSVINKYSNALSEDELSSCALEGLRRCISYHDDSRGQKFTTSLWRFVDWECKRELRKRKVANETPCTVSIMDFKNFDLPAKDDMTNSYLHDCIGLLPTDYQKLIHDYYFERMTMDEIGTKHGFSKESARQKISKALIRLREIYADKS